MLRSRATKLTCPHQSPILLSVMNIKSITANLTEITTASNDQILVSYSTPVAARVEGAYFKTAQKFSKTTSRHISKWLESIKATEKDQSFFDNLLTVTA